MKQEKFTLPINIPLSPRDHTIAAMGQENNTLVLRRSLSRDYSKSAIKAHSEFFGKWS